MVILSIRGAPAKTWSCCLSACMYLRQVCPRSLGVVITQPKTAKGSANLILFWRHIHEHREAAERALFQFWGAVLLLFQCLYTHDVLEVQLFRELLYNTTYLRVTWRSRSTMWHTSAWTWTTHLWHMRCVTLLSQHQNKAGRMNVPYESHQELHIASILRPCLL